MAESELTTEGGQPVPDSVSSLPKAAEPADVDLVESPKDGPSSDGDLEEMRRPNPEIGNHVGAVGGTGNNQLLGNNIYFGPASRAASEMKSGSIPEEEVEREIVKYYRRAIDTDLEQKLADQRCVVMVGAKGSGRSTAAIVSLARLTGKVRKVKAAEESAAEYPVQGKTGHVVHISSTRSLGLTEVDLRYLAEKCAEEQSFYVLISDNVEGHSHLDLEQTFEWCAPPLQELIEYSDDCPTLNQEQLNRLEPTCSVQQKIKLIDCLIACEHNSQSIDQVIESHTAEGQKKLFEWIDDERSFDEWTLLISVAFLNGAPLFVFAEALDQLRHFASEMSLALDLKSYSRHVAKRQSVPVDVELQKSRASIETIEYEADELGAPIQILMVSLDDSVNDLTYLEEVWKKMPTALRPSVFKWLQDTARHGDLVVAPLGGRVAQIARFDTELCHHVVDGWARQDNYESNRLAAWVVNTLATAGDTERLGEFIAHRWGTQNDVARRAFTGLMAFEGTNLSRTSAPLAFEVYEYQVKKRPISIRPYWCAHVKQIADDPELTQDLVERLHAMRNETDPPMSWHERNRCKKAQFLLLEHLFTHGTLTGQGELSQPVVLNLLTHDATSEGLTRLIARWLISENTAATWLKEILTHIDHHDNTTAKSVGSFLYRTLKMLKSDRQGEIIPWLREYLDNWDERKTRPSVTAINRCHELFDLIDEALVKE